MIYQVGKNTGFFFLLQCVYFLDILDKRVKNWLLMDNPGPLLMILAAYFLFVLKLGPQFMEHRKPFNLNIVIRTYNIFQIVVCTIIIFKVIILYFLILSFFFEQHTKQHFQFVYQNCINFSYFILGYCFVC